MPKFLIHSLPQCDIEIHPEPSQQKALHATANPTLKTNDPTRGKNSGNGFVNAWAQLLLPKEFISLSNRCSEHHCNLSGDSRAHFSNAYLQHNNGETPAKNPFSHGHGHSARGRSEPGVAGCQLVAVIGVIMDLYIPTLMVGLKHSCPG